ncbi:hypothetical protein [Phenylobacterium sp.]|uniref:hypothetical protein n=1 Tax=Phenylobacterium sp. TaxID=1871053 RepID=UPI0037848EC9
MRSTLGKGLLVAAAGAMALSAGAASAQPYGQYGYYDGGYDPCRREANGRGVVGALLGGAIGAAVGANAAARNNRQDGALLGGGVGAIAGAMVGKNGAACTGGPRTTYAPPSSAYYDGGYRDYGYGYGDRGYRPGRYVERDSWGDGRGFYSDDAYAYGHRGQRYRLAQRPIDADGCTMAESPIYMPDGRTQTRMVRVCQDSRGRYQVVD